MVKKLLLIVATAGFLSSSVLAAPPPPPTFDVHVTNWPEQLPFCPCFSQDDLDEVLGTGAPEDCQDLRLGLSAVRTAVEMDTVAEEGRVVSVGYNGTSYYCRLQKSDQIGGAVVDFQEIGFDNAMACRALIVNSPQWALCPAY